MCWVRGGHECGWKTGIKSVMVHKIWETRPGRTHCCGYRKAVNKTQQKRGKRFEVTTSNTPRNNDANLCLNFHSKNIKSLIEWTVSSKVFVLNLLLVNKLFFVCVSETFIAMRNREMILEDESDESQKVCSFEDKLINIYMYTLHTLLTYQMDPSPG